MYIYFNNKNVYIYIYIYIYSQPFPAKNLAYTTKLSLLPSPAFAKYNEFFLKLAKVKIIQLEQKLSDKKQATTTQAKDN